jgi:hypothetical protein
MEIVGNKIALDSLKWSKDIEGDLFISPRYVALFS